jgi:hypothetical protein
MFEGRGKHSYTFGISWHNFEFEQEASLELEQEASLEFILCANMWQHRTLNCVYMPKYASLYCRTTESVWMRLRRKNCQCTNCWCMRVMATPYQHSVAVEQAIFRQTSLHIILLLYAVLWSNITWPMMAPLAAGAALRKLSARSSCNLVGSSSLPIHVLGLNVVERARRAIIPNGGRVALAPAQKINPQRVRSIKKPPNNSSPKLLFITRENSVVFEDLCFDYCCLWKWQLKYYTWRRNDSDYVGAIS